MGALVACMRALHGAPTPLPVPWLIPRPLLRQNLISFPQNGGKAFVPAIQKVTLHYDQPRMGAGGNCVGMVAFVKEGLLLQLARERPHVEVCVAPAPRQPPMLVAQYANGRERRVDCSRWGVGRIAREFRQLCDEHGGKPRQKYVLPVQGGALGSGVERVSGVWDPFHASSTGATLFRP